MQGQPEMEALPAAQLLPASVQAALLDTAPQAVAGLQQVAGLHAGVIQHFGHVILAVVRLPSNACCRSEQCSANACAALSFR